MAIGFALSIARDYGRIATGFFAKGLCSGVFVAGRQAEEVVSNDLRIYPPGPVFKVIEWRLDAAGGTVVARMPWALASSQAVYRPGLGCALWPGEVPARALTPVGPRSGSSPSPKSVASALQPWPEGDAVDDRLLTEAQRQQLARAIERGFAEIDQLQPRRTRAIAVIHRGRLVAQRYADGFDHRTRMAGWSMAKSVTAAWVARLVHERRLQVDEPLALSVWRTAGDPRAALTFRQLLNMSSGLAFSEVYDSPRSDVTQMLFFSTDAAGFAARRPVVAPPDQVFNYSSGTTNLISLALRERLGEQYHSAPAHLLFAPLGMDSALFEADASGTLVGSSYLWATAQDWARFGLLFAREGEWGARRLLPEGWSQWTRQPSPASRVYGAHWWLADATDPESQRLPGDFFQATGHGGQRLSVIPSEDLVIVRLGLTLHPQVLRHAELVNEIRAALGITAQLTPAQQTPPLAQPALR